MWDISKALRSIPAAFTSVLDALPCAGVLLDEHAVIAHANNRACELFGRSPSDIVGVNLLTVYADARDLDLGPLRRLVENPDRADEIELFVPRKDGQKIPVIISAGVHGDLNGFSGKRILTMVDISSRKKAEARVAAEYREIARISDTLLSTGLELQEHSRGLEARVRERTAELHDANMAAIYMLAIASEAKDVDTGRHVRRIQHYAEALARRFGMTEHAAHELGYSALLHDVGKMLIPDEILKKPSGLNDEERRIMEMHTVAGEKILSTRSFFATARQIARSHHEDWDGSGYPDGLAGEAIPLSARIVHLVDVYDALVSDRVYKDAVSPTRSAEAIQNGAGRNFDPVLVEAFMDAFQDGAFEEIHRRVASAERDLWFDFRSPAE